MDYSARTHVDLNPLWLERATEIAHSKDLSDLRTRCERALSTIVPANLATIVLTDDEPTSTTPYAQELIRLRHGEGVTRIDGTAFVPLRVGDRLVGWVQLLGGAYNGEIAPAISAVAAIIGPTAYILAERSRVELDRHRRTIINAISELRGELDMQRLLSSLHTIVQQRVPTSNMMIILTQNDHDWLKVVYLVEQNIPQDRHFFWRNTNGLTSAVIRERAVIYSNDYLAECRRRGIQPLNFTMDWSNGAWMGAPIADGAGVIGAIVISDSRPDWHFSPEHADLLALIATEAAAPLRSALLYQRAAEQARRLDALNRISRTINSSLDPGHVPQLIMEQVQELFDVEEGSLLLRDDETDELVFSYASGPAGNRLLGKRLAVGLGIAGHVALNNQAAVVNDTRGDGRFYTGADRSTGFNTRSLLAVPLRGIDGVRGVIEVMNRRNDAPFIDEDRLLLEAVADQAVIALENARRFAKVDQALARRARDLDQINDQLRKILRLGSTLRADRPIEDLLGDVARAVYESTPFQHVLVALVERDRVPIPVLRRVAAAGSVADHLEPLRQTRAPLSHLLPLLTGDRQRSPQTYVLRRSSADYAQLWSDSLPPLPEVFDDVNPGDWHPHDVLYCLMRDSRGVLQGVLLVSDPEDESQPSAEQVQVLEIFANQAAAAIESARLYVQQQHNLSSMTAINGLGLALNTALRVEERIFEMTASGMVALIDAVGASVFMVDAQHPESLHLAYRYGNLEAVLPDVGAALSHDVLSSGRVMEFRGTSHDPFQLPVGIAIPLRATRQIVGVICLGLLTGRPDPADVESLSLYASQAAIAIESLRLFTALREGRDQLASIMASTREGMLLFDQEGAVAVANAAFPLLANLTDEPVEALTIDALLDRWQASVNYQFTEWQRLGEGLRAVSLGQEETAHGQLNDRRSGARSLEWTVLRASRDDQAAETSSSGPARPSLLVLRDITAAKEAERLRQDLTSMIVHDLRSPLSSILTSIDMIFRGISGEVNSTQRDILSIAYTSARHLLEMVNLLLDISRLEGGKMPLNRETISVEQVAQRAINRLEAIARSKRIAIELRIAPDSRLIHADGDLLLRVLQNLLDNALKFSPTDNQVLVWVENTTDENAAEGEIPQPMVKFAVRDFGLGIKPHDQAKIFTKFGQAGERRGNGTGLGLTFCKLVIEAHGGQIWVESTYGKGSTFAFTLPALDFSE